MKPRHVITLIAIVFGSMLFFDRVPERTVYPDQLVEGLDAAKRDNKCILLVFSGSDWCELCIKLDDEVFSQSEFKEFADEHLVIVSADFPRDRSGKDETVLEKNEKLARAFGVKGFPTVFILDSDGRKIARTGYRLGGADAYVEHLEKLIASAR